MGTNVFLIGFMGSGKTTLGRLLARKLGWRFVDSDRAIARRLGMSISTIFERQGEARFRNEETREIARIARRRSQVVSLGAGSLIRAQNRRVVTRAGLLVHLQTSPRSVLKRVWKRRAQRPLLKGLSRDDCLRRIRALLRQRAPGYRFADLAIRTDKRKPEALARDLLMTLRSRR
jgi:shikimate kinase